MHRCPATIPRRVPVLVRIAAAVASAVLVVEFTLAGIAGVAGMAAGRERLAQLTRQKINPRFLFVLGLLELAGVAAVIAGFRYPGAAVVAALFFAAVAGTVLTLQVVHGDRGTALIAYSLFFTSALVLLASRLATA
jgi:uncharacterized membrane protein YphA (DoxX/SURF4 family)